MAEIGSAFVSILPSVKGLGAAIQQQAGPQIDRAGTDAGRRYGNKMGAHLKGAGKAIFAPLAAAAAAVGVGNFLKDSLAEARESQKVGALTANVIKQTGGAAKITAAQVGELAGAISAKTGQDDEAIQSGANLLLTFKNVRNEVGAGSNIFDRATAAAVDLSAAGFGSVESASKGLGKALNDPIKGITALARSGVTFTEQQKAQIKTLVESGDTLGAQKIIMKELESQVGGAAAASATFGEKASVAFGNVKEQIGTALLPVIDRLGKVFVTTIAPAISGFISGLQNGTGAGGRLAAVVSGLVGFFQRYHKILVPVVAVVGAMGVAIGVVSAATKAYAAVQGVLNAVMAANPIGIVVVVLAGLVAALVIAYKRSETFRKVVQAAWSGIRTAASVAWRVVAPILSTLAKWLGVYLVTAFKVYAAVGKAAFNAVRAVVSTAWVKVIKPTFTALKTFIGSTLPGAFETGRSQISAKWTAAKDRVKAVWDKGIKPVLQAVSTFIKTTVPNAFESGRASMGAKWSAARDRIKNVWDKSLKPVFNAVNTMIKTTVPAAFDTGVKAIKTAWDKIKGYAARPINFVIGTVLNKGILAAFNSVAGSILGKKAPHINSLPLVKFAQGSEDHRAQIARPGDMRLWAEPETGGEAYIPLHPRKRARSTHILGQVAQRFGYQLHQFANGGTLVKAGKHLKQLGYDVAEGPPPFGPVHRVHTANSAHYRGLAIDVNHGAGTSRAEQAALSRIVPYLKGLGLRVIFMAPGHKNHLHAEATGKGSILGRIAGAAGNVLGALDPRKLITKGLDKLSGIPGAGSPFAKTVAGVPRKLAGMLVTKAKDMLSSINPFGDTSDNGGGGGSGGAQRWRGLVSRVLGELGRPQTEMGAVLRRIQFESGGNPRAINLTDSNARAGHPSRGLMQTIPGTFNAYAGKYRSRGIFDPLANIYAGSNYALKRYGSLRAIDPRVRPKGYDQGGWLQPGMTMVENRTGKPEPVLNPEQWAALSKSGAGIQFNAPVYTQTPQEFARQLVAEQRLHEALHPTFG